jgi:hypothetical protein
VAKIFISHIHEDQQAALYLSEFLHAKLETQPEDIFLSSNQQISLGSEWLQAIGRSMATATIIIALFSRESATRQWVHFEAGGAFFNKNKSLIPLCIGGIKPTELGKPYANIQGADLHEWNTAQYLIRTITKALRPELRLQASLQFEPEDAAVRKLIDRLDAWKRARTGTVSRRIGDAPPELATAVIE